MIKIVEKIKSREKFNQITCLSFIVFSLLILFLIISKTADFIFVSNDDIFLQAILSGKITGSPDAHAVYILYPLAWVITLFYRLVPDINWYGLFIVGIHFSCWMIILGKVVSLAANKWEQIRNLFITYFLLIFLNLQWLIFSQYTALASIIACTALICIICAKDENRLCGYTMPIILLAISFMLRNSAAIMCFVFVLIYMIIKLIYYRFDQKNKKAVKELRIIYIKVLSIIFIAFIGSFLIHKAAYQAEEWKYYDEYNNFRTEIYDYYLYPGYDENEEFYQSIGIDEEEMYLIQSANLDLDTSITSDTLKAIYEKSKELKENSLQFTNVPRRLIFDYLDSFEDANRELICLYLLYGVALILAIKSKKSAYLFGIIFVFLARSGMRSYLLFVERFPDRVASPLALIEIVTLIGIILMVLKNEKKYPIEEKNSQVGYKLGIALIVLFMILLLADVYKENLDRVSAIEEEDAWAENLLPYMVENNESTYMLDVYSVAPMKSLVFGENEYPENAIILGGWLQESPLLEQQYTNRFHEMSNEDLLFEENVYFVQRSDLTMDWLVDYFESKNKSIQVETVKIIRENEKDVFTVYRLKLINSIY